MTLETAFDLPFWFEFAATVTGGLSGGMSAVRARYDIFGTVAIACITGMGGGIIRDILLQNYGLYAFQSPWFLLSCALAGPDAPNCRRPGRQADAMRRNAPLLARKLKDSKNVFSNFPTRWLKAKTLRPCNSR